MSEPWTPLFALVFADAPGWLELRAFPSKSRVFLRPNDNAGIARFIVQHQEEDVYYGIATRRDPNAEHPGALGNCEALGVLFTDVDFKTTPEPDAHARLVRLPFAPSAVVHSGGGWHVYYGLKEPFVLPDEAPEATRALRRLARTLGGDVSAAEPARILRLPGTANFKRQYGSPRLVRLIEHGYIATV